MPAEKWDRTLLAVLPQPNSAPTQPTLLPAEPLGSLPAPRLLCF